MDTLEELKRRDEELQRRANELVSRAESALNIKDGEV